MLICQLVTRLTHHADSTCSDVSVAVIEFFGKHWLRGTFMTLDDAPKENSIISWTCWFVVIIKDLFWRFDQSKLHVLMPALQLLLQPTFMYFPCFILFYIILLFSTFCINKVQFKVLYSVIRNISKRDFRVLTNAYLKKWIYQSSLKVKNELK